MQLNWGTGAAAALYGIALGLLENKRQQNEDARKMKIDEERQARHVMGQMLIKAASEGQDLSPLMKSTTATKMFDEPTLSAINALATTTRNEKMRQEQLLGMGGTVTPQPAQTPDVTAAAPAPAPAASAPMPATYQPTMPPAPIETAGQGVTAEQPTPALPEPNPAMLVAGGGGGGGVEATAEPAPAQAPTPPPAPMPAAAPPRQVQPMSHMQQVSDLTAADYYKPGELKRVGEGVSVSIPKIGGGTISMKGPNEEELGRRIFSRAQERGYSYAATVDSIVQRGAKLPDDLRAYGSNLADRDYANELRKITNGGERTPTIAEAKQAAQNTFLRVGYVSDAIKPLLIPTKEDETNLWARTYLAATQQGRGILAATNLANATGAVPDISAVKYLQETTKAEIQSAIENDPRTRDWAPEQKQKLLSQMTQFVGQTPEERATIAKPAPMAAGTEQQLYEKTGKVPRLSDYPGGKAPDITGARQEAQSIEAGQAGAVARERKAQEQTIPEKPTQQQQEQEINREAAKKLSNDILRKYDELGTNIGGAFGSQSKLSQFKSRLNDQQQAQFAELRADAQQLRAHLLHALSGAQVSYRDPYLAVLPDIENNSNVEFKANVRATVRNIERLQQTSFEVQRRSGVSPAGRPPLVLPK